MEPETIDTTIRTLLFILGGASTIAVCFFALVGFVALFGPYTIVPQDRPKNEAKRR